MFTIMFRDEQSKWNLLFSALFIVLVALAYTCLLSRGIVPSGIPLADALVLVLATFRLVRLFVYDHVTQLVRDLFLDITVCENGDLVRNKPATGPRRTLAALLGCPWCFGVWVAFVLTYAYFATPHAWFVLLALAIAGVGTLLQIIANLIGWHAEGAKRAVTKDENPGQHSGQCG
jgi:hypothetical protein